MWRFAVRRTLADVALCADDCLTTDVASARRGPCIPPIGLESRTMRNDFMESAGSVEYSMGGDTECGRTLRKASFEGAYHALTTVCM